MTYTATIDDWYSLLGVNHVLPALFEGESTLGETQQALLVARQDWPGTNEDYVAVIDGLDVALAEVAAAILEQDRALASLRSTIGDIEASVPEDFPGGMISAPPMPVDRLLTVAERDLLDAIKNELDDLLGEIENWSSRLEDEAEEAEDAANAAEEEADEEDDEP